MNDADVGTFDRAFRRVVGAFRVRLKAADVDELSRTYFRVLIDEPLDDVLASGKLLLQRSKKFPLPAEWLDMLHARTTVVAPADVRSMTVDESVEYARAERLRWEDASCACLLCQSAGVTHRLVRFVPDCTDDGRDDRAHDTVRDRVITTGHWAHGDELAGWYAEHDRFFALAPAGIARVLRQPDPRSLAARVDAIYRPLTDREPGEEG